MSMTRATAARNTPLAARPSPTATRMRAQKRVKLGFMVPPGVDSVATEYSGRLLGVSRNPETRVARALALVASLALAGLVVVITVFVTTRADVVSPGAPGPAAVPAKETVRALIADAGPAPAP